MSPNLTPDEPEPSSRPPGLPNDPERWAAALAAMQRLRERGTFAEITDVVAWQREIRRDRPLLGREP